MYSDTVTLFNRKRNTSGDTWYVTVLSGVDFNADKAAIMSRYGANSQDRALLHVKVDGSMVGGKTYLLPKAWQEQTLDAVLSSSLTFTDGEGFDFFIFGEWDGDTVVEDNDYPAGLYDYCNKHYDHCYAVTSAAQYSVIPHIEVTGR